MEEFYDLIQQRYDIDRQLYDLRGELLKLEAEYPRHLNALRQAEEKFESYNTGSIATFLDKIFGKYEEKKEQLSIDARCAQVSLSSCKIQLDTCKKMISSLELDSQKLPTREELFEKFPDDFFLKQQDTYFCVYCLLPSLDRNLVFLLNARDWAENRCAEHKALGTLYDMSLALKNGSECAGKACVLMEQINSNGFTFEIHPYFLNPDGFIASVARQYGQQDRMNYAISAVRSAMNAAQELLQTLKETLNIERN